MRHLFEGLSITDCKTALTGTVRLNLTLLVKCPVGRNGGDQMMLLLVTV